MAVTTATVADFLKLHPVAAIQIDAAWDIPYREKTREIMRRAEAELGCLAAFGEIDADTEWKYCRDVNVVNVPCVAYYRDGKLVAVIVSAFQNVTGGVRALLDDPMITAASLRRAALGQGK